MSSRPPYGLGLSGTRTEDNEWWVLWRALSPFTSPDVPKYSQLGCTVLSSEATVQRYHGRQHDTAPVRDDFQGPSAEMAYRARQTSACILSGILAEMPGVVADSSARQCDDYGWMCRAVAAVLILSGPTPDSVHWTEYRSLGAAPSPVDPNTALLYLRSHAAAGGITGS